MSQFVSEAAAAIVAEGAIRATDFLLRRFSGSRSSRKHTAISEEIVGLIQARLASPAQSAEDGNRLPDGLTAFLRSAEFDALCRQAIALCLVRGASTLPGPLTAPFDAAIQLYSRPSTYDASGYDDRALLRLMCVAVEVALNHQGVTMDALSDESQSDLRVTVLSQQLESLQATAEVLAKPFQADTRTIAPFADAYRRAVADRFSEIVTPHWNAAPRVPLATST